MNQSQPLRIWVLLAGLGAQACTLDLYSQPGGSADASVASPAAPSSETSADEPTSCEEDECGQDACDDGVKNNGETGVDCGGACEPCAARPSCSDGKRNQDETGVDCGGQCDPCKPSASCDDGVQNQDETGTDCGGECEPCAVSATCEDELQNQDETGVDCGGQCEACPPPETCNDGTQNQDETGVDCGGICAACSSCDDGVQNQDEVGIDCGGACGACPLEGSSKFIGNITQGGMLPPDFGKWNQLTPENEGKWRHMEPARDEMNWDQMDDYYAYTRSRGIPFKAHTFCWGSQQPDWIDALSAEEQAHEVEEYIQSFCERYPGVEYIDAVNEPEHAPPTYRDALGGAGETGHDWVLQCFAWARQHCPDATLILNDYNVLRWDTDQFLAIARKVKAAGFLDAVGEQGHGLETITMSELKFNMSRLAGLDVPIFISEYDVDLADDAQQLAVYVQQFPFFYNHPQVVGITLWGYIQGQTWLENTFLERANGSHRPAYDWLIETYLMPGYLCGNAACEPNEDCNSCSMDCGACEEQCSDGQQSNGETSPDCGGPCGACQEPAVADSTADSEL